MSFEYESLSLSSPLLKDGSLEKGGEGKKKIFFKSSNSKTKLATKQRNGVLISHKCVYRRRIDIIMHCICIYSYI